MKARVVAAVLTLAAMPAHARTVGVVPQIVLRTRPPPKLAPGAPGTLAHAAELQEKRRKKRPQTEGTIPERDPDGGCPKEMGNVDGRFCADRWEATLEDEAGTPWPPTQPLDPARTYRAVSRAGVVPQGYISGAQAEAACVAAGKRLCGAAEWRIACAGSEATVYPYGPTYEAARCNDHGRAPMAVYYPEIGRSWAAVSNRDMNDPRLNQLEGTVAHTGAHGGCVNDFGLFDMVGNLHEWTSDPHGTFEGGYYLDTRANGEGCAYRTSAHDFDYHDYSTGFRCCADLRPAADEP